MSSARAQLRVAPLCMAIGVVEYRAWMGRAQAGERITFAQGPALDNQRDIVVLVKEHQARGLVRFFRKRRGEDDFNFIVERLAPEAADPAVQRARAKDGRSLAPDPESEPGKVLALLRRCANLDQPCPTNREIALRCGLNDEERARYLVRQLAEGGHVAIENRGPRLTRIVTIAETKRSTSRAETPVGKGYQPGTPVQSGGRG